MRDDLRVSVKQLVADVKMGKPHVVVLGAGASRAACPNGDKHQKTLPLMSDFINVVGLKSQIKDLDVDPGINFEDVYSDLYERGEEEKIVQIENAVKSYFNQLELPDKPTIYDHLVLSLREKDLIATFNWDPLLLHAYLRNSNAGLKLPRLAFLHGNVRVGYCEKDKVSGIARMTCRHCGKTYQSAPLLYPIKQKNYAEDSFIVNEWKKLKWGFRNAFMITIFGYSGPKTDQEAISAMKEAWGHKNQRAMEQTAFITIQSRDEIAENWEPFIHTHHYEIHDNFYSSWIANFPRRTGEAYYNQYIKAKVIKPNRIPQNMDFPQLWKWYEQFKEVESGA